MIQSSVKFSSSEYRHVDQEDTSKRDLNTVIQYLQFVKHTTVAVKAFALTNVFKDKMRF